MDMTFTQLRPADNPKSKIQNPKSHYLSITNGLTR